MATCLVNRNPQGNIVEVTTPSGEKSELFEAINSNVFLGDTETSLQIYANAYSKNIQNRFKEVLDIEVDKQINPITVPSKLNFLPNTLNLVHYSKKNIELDLKMSVENIPLEDKYDEGNSILDGIYLSDSPAWATNLDGYKGAHKIKVKNEGLLYFNTQAELQDFIKNKLNLDPYSQKLEVLSALRSMGVKGILNRGFDVGEASELIVIDNSAIEEAKKVDRKFGASKENVSLYNDVTKLPSFSSARLSTEIDKTVPYFSYNGSSSKKGMTREEWLRATQRSSYPLSEEEVSRFNEEAKVANDTEADRSTYSTVYRTGEPKIFYKSSANKQYEDIEDMLIANEVGETFMGFKDPSTSEFIPIAKFNTEATEKSRFLSKNIQEGVLSPRRVLGEDGVTRFQGEGQFAETRKASAKAFQFDAVLELGNGNVKVRKDGTVDANFNQDTITVLKEDGTTGVMSLTEEAPKYDEIQNKVQAVVAKVMATKNTRPLYDTKTQSTSSPESLKSALMNFLETLGFSVSTLEEYRKNYKTKYGEDPDIAAIADLTNKVVAIAEGRDITEELLEEVSHIAIEAYSEQGSIAGALASVHLTPEYAEFAETYRAKYSEFSQGLELEDKVRKEVLGKILAKSIKSNFDLTNVNENQHSLISKLKGIWDSFKNFLSGKVRGYHKSVIGDLNNEIALSIITQQDSKFNKNLIEDGFFYDLQDPASTKIEKGLKVAKESLERVYKTILKSSTPQQRELDKIMDDMAQVDILTSANALKGITTKLLNRVKASVLEAENSGTLLPIEQTGVFNSILSNTIPALLSIKSHLSEIEVSPENKSTKEALIKDIDALARLRDEISPKIDEDYSKHVSEMTEKVLEETTLTEEEKKSVIKEVESNSKDIGFMQNLFGLVSQSTNLFIQMLHQRVSKMTSDTNTETLSIANQTIKNIFDKGLQKYQSSVLKKFKGKATAFFEGPINHAKYEEYLNDQKIEIIHKLTKKSKQEIEKVILAGLPLKNILDSDANMVEYKNQYKAVLRESGEQIRKDKYYEERDVIYNEVGLHEATREVMANISRERADLYNKVRSKDGSGRVDRSLMTEQDRLEEQNIQKNYKLEKSAYDQHGEIKAGLRVVSSEELTEEEKKAYNVFETTKGDVIVPEKGMTKDDLSEVARVSYDMNALGRVYQSNLSKEEKTQDVSEEYKKIIEDLEAQGISAYDWATSNGSLVLNEEFYNSINGEASYTKRVEDYIASIEDVDERKEKSDLLLEYKRKSKIKSGLLKQARNNRNSLEIDAHDMEAPSRRKVLEIEDDLTDLKYNINLPFDENFQYESDSIKTTNESFDKMRIEAGISERAFAMKHMSRENTTKVNEFKNNIEAYFKGRRKGLKKVHQRIVTEAKDKGLLSDSLLEKYNSKNRATKLAAINEMTNILTTEYAKQNVASYFVRFEPKGYSQFIEKLKDVNGVKLSDFINNKEAVIATNPVAKYLDMKPDYTWMQDLDAEDTVNKQYDPEGPFRQPKVSKFVDKEFFDKYGINMEKWMEEPTMDLSKLVATKNQEEFEYLQTMIDLNKKAIENYGDTGTANPFQRVQKTKTGVEGALTLDYKDAIKDIFTNRVDEKEYGEQVDASNLADDGYKVIPKYFQTRVPAGEEANLTESTVEATILNLKQSILYKNRIAAENDFKALEWKIKNQEFKAASKIGSVVKKTIKGETSVYLKQAQEYIGHHLYGIRQNRQMTTSIMGRPVDLTRVITKIQSFVKFSNLGFNPIVDLTSMTTGVLNNLSDRITQEYYANSSANKAMSQVTSLLGEYLTESSKVNKESLLNHYMEFFGLQDLESRIENTRYGRGIRAVSTSAFKFSKFANLPVGPRNLFAVLNDYRYIDGRFINFNDYYTKRKTENKRITKKTAAAQFNKYDKDSLFENIKATKDGITFNDNFLSKFDSKEEAQEAFDKLRKTTSQKAKTIAQLADGVLNTEDQVAAQRDILSNTLMMHRGWLPILLTKRFKGKQFNISTGKSEEGHFRTMINLAPKVFKAAKESTIPQFWQEMTELERNNIQRTAFEILLWGGLMALGKLIMSFDDDDDSYLEDLAQYVYIRTVSEFSTQQMHSIPKSVIDVMENPFVAIRTIKALEPVELIMDLGTSPFKESSRKALAKRFIKNTPAKRWSQFSDLKKQLASYQHFNKSTLYILSPENLK